MPKPKNDPGDSFGPTDLAIGSGLTVRNIQHLSDAHLLPAGKGVQTLKRMAIIGAMVSGGVPLVDAGRLAAAASWNRVSQDSEANTGMRQWAASLPAGYVRPDVEVNDYWAHRWVRTAAADGKVKYSVGSAIVGDTVVEIVDRRFLLARNVWSDATLTDPDFVARISGWGSGASLEVVPWWDDLQPDESAAAALSYRPNAVAVLAINVSLAIRNALDRIMDHRAARLVRMQGGDDA